MYWTELFKDPKSFCGRLPAHEQYCWLFRYPIEIYYPIQTSQKRKKIRYNTDLDSRWTKKLGTTLDKDVQINHRKNSFRGHLQI